MAIGNHRSDEQDCARLKNKQLQSVDAYFCTKQWVGAHFFAKPWRKEKNLDVFFGIREHVDIRKKKWWGKHFKKKQTKFKASALRTKTTDMRSKEVLNSKKNSLAESATKKKEGKKFFAYETFETFFSKTKIFKKFCLGENLRNIFFRKSYFGFEE